MTASALARQGIIVVQAPRQGLYEITGEIASWLDNQSIQLGILNVFIRHTSASLVIQENVDPTVMRDLEAFLDKLAPEDEDLYAHRAEGPDDMPAHIKTALTQCQLAIPVSDRRMMLGTYQGIFLFEHRRRPRAREIVLHATGQ